MLKTAERQLSSERVLSGNQWECWITDKKANSLCFMGFYITKISFKLARGHKTMQYYRTAVDREQLIHILDIQLIRSITVLPLIEGIKKRHSNRMAPHLQPNGSHW